MAVPIRWFPSTLSLVRQQRGSRTLRRHHRRRCYASCSASSAPAKDSSMKCTKTDEGVFIYESLDPSTVGGGLGLVWGSVLWPSGVSLAKYFSTKPQVLRSKHILELGAGTGIVGLTLAKLGASHVYLTDSETSALWPMLRKSIEANGLGEVSIHRLDWRDPTQFLLEKNFDLVVATDVLYAGMDKLFTRALASHISNETVAYVACPYRKDSPLLGFFDACLRLGLELERLQDEHGNAVGAVMGMDANKVFQDARFVPLDTSEDRQRIGKEPTFGEYNTEKVQIFCVRRVSGSPEEAASIRRIRSI